MENPQNWHCSYTVENVADFNAYVFCLDGCIIENWEMSNFSFVHMVFHANIIF